MHFCSNGDNLVKFKEHFLRHTQKFAYYNIDLYCICKSWFVLKFRQLKYLKYIKYIDYMKFNRITFISFLTRFEIKTGKWSHGLVCIYLHILHNSLIIDLINLRKINSVWVTKSLHQSGPDRRRYWHVLSIRPAISTSI